MNHRSPTPIGQRFAKLTVVGDAPDRRSLRRVLCRCDCGATHEATLADLIRGHIHSCGCLGGKLRHGHGRRGKFTPEYKTWSQMLQRCENPRCPSFARYGGLGVSVCPQWHDFPTFLADMGDRPSIKHSIDRINPTGDYEPGNCRWATALEQARNKRNAVWVMVNGESRRIWDAESDTGLTYGTIRSRIGRGQSIDDPPRGSVRALGAVKTCDAWSSETGVPVRVIRRRIAHGWEPDRAVSQPVRKWGTLYQ